MQTTSAAPTTGILKIANSRVLLVGHAAIPSSESTIRANHTVNITSKV
jgi:hypothetical protein